MHDFFYYVEILVGQIEKEPLDLCTQRLGVCFHDGITDADKAAIVAGVPLLRPFDERQREFTERWAQERNYYVLRTRPCTTAAQVLGVMAQLNATAGVKYAAPVFDSIDAALSDEISAAVPASVSVDDIQDLAELLHIDLFDSTDLSSIGRVVYFFRLTDESRMNALDTANTLTEHPLTIAATPEWLPLYNVLEDR